MTTGTKEHFEILKQFEKNFKHLNIEKENKDLCK